MNTAQINIDPETGNEVTEDCPESSHTPSNDRYNLRPWHIRKNTKYTMLQNSQPSLSTSNHQPNLHKRGHREVKSMY